MDVKLFKIQKATNFKHFSPKIFHISPFKTMYIYTFATVTVHIYTVIVAVYPIILLISHFAPFFSLSSSCKTNSVSDFSSAHLLFPQTHTNTPTHKHIHIDKSIQRYTNTPTRTNQQRDRSVLVLVTCGSVLVALDQSSWVNRNGFGCL